MNVMTLVSPVGIGVVFLGMASIAFATQPVLDLPPESSFGPQGEARSSEAKNESATLEAFAIREIEPGLFESAFPIFGTWAEFQISVTDPEDARRLVALAREELRRIDALMSEWRSDSPVSAINANAGKQPVEVPSELFELIAKSLDVAKRSVGAFDPTWAGMRGLWKFGDVQDGSVPTADEIEKKRPLVNFRRVRLRCIDRRKGVEGVEGGKCTVFLEQEGMALGLGGIAKGYAVDRVVQIFRASGITDFVVRIGGDLFAAGKRKGVRSWSTGIRDPRASDKVFASLKLSNQALSTSGDYERYFVRDGVRYHHIIDPRTGRPATACRSVTALCADTYTADSVTKPVFILGPKKGIPFAKSVGCEVLIVDAANRVHISPGIRTRVVLTPPSP